VKIEQKIGHQDMPGQSQQEFSLSSPAHLHSKKPAKMLLLSSSHSRQSLRPH